MGRTLFNKTRWLMSESFSLLQRVAFLWLAIFVLESRAVAEPPQLTEWEWEKGAPGEYQGVFTEDGQVYRFRNNQNSAFLSGYPIKVCDLTRRSQLRHCRMPWQVVRKVVKKPVGDSDPVSPEPVKEATAVRPSTEPKAKAPETEEQASAPWSFDLCQALPAASLALSTGRDSEHDAQGPYSFGLAGQSAGFAVGVQEQCRDYLAELNGAAWWYGASAPLTEGTSQNISVYRDDLNARLYKRIGEGSLPSRVSLWLGVGAGVMILPSFNLISYSTDSIFPSYSANYSAFRLAYPLLAARLGLDLGGALLRFDESLSYYKNSTYNMSGSQEKIMVTKPLSGPLSATASLTIEHTSYQDSREDLQLVSYMATLGVSMSFKP